MAAGASWPGGPPRLAVAVSGGLDSTCLLHATVRCARQAGVDVHALHVHHGLQADADRWLRDVARRCRRWGGIGFHAHKVAGRPAPGDSLEAWARRERYAALAELARGAGCGVVLLAHHRRDQAETVLLQALRGAGPAGLAAMPRQVTRDGLQWVRPWLDHPHERIEAYARRWRLTGAQDPSNEDCRWARSRIRQRVLPALRGAFTDAETALAAVARRAQEARELLGEVAAIDVAAACDDIGLVRSRWLALSPARRVNALRHWLRVEIGRGVPESLVQRLLVELPESRDGHWPAGALTLSVHGAHLVLHRLTPQMLRLPVGMDLAHEGLYRLPGLDGVLQVTRCRDGGVPAQLLAGAECVARQAGLRFQLQAAGVPRSLKKQFQQRDVPRWCRDGPIVVSRGLPLFVAGLGLDARALALPGEPRFALEWLPGAAPQPPARPG